MSTVSVDPTVAYRPKPILELLLKENILGSFRSKETPAGITTKFIKKNVFDEPVSGASCIKRLTVASAVACVLVINIELMLFTPSPGNNNSISTPEATPL